MLKFYFAENCRVIQSINNHYPFILPLKYIHNDVYFDPLILDYKLVALFSRRTNYLQNGIFDTRNLIE